MALPNLIRTFGNSGRRFWHALDWRLWIPVLVLLGISLINISGIVGFHGLFFRRQVFFVGGGILLALLNSSINYRVVRDSSLLVLLGYGATILLLLFALISPPIRGSHAWIVLGSVTFEPSELAKLTFIAVMAKYFSQRHIVIHQFRHVLASALYLGLPLGIILIQPDLGSAVLLISVWFGMLLASGMSRRHVFGLVALGIVVVVSGWIFALKPYQRERLAAFVNPYRDRTGIGYNIIQSQVAIGSGYWIGTGWGQGTQSRLGFLPESHNDFAFAAWVEQFGAVGLGILLAAIFALLSRILTIGQNARDNFAKLFCIGMVIFIATHVIVNAAVNIGLLPITGIPFSFLSYGGSHLAVLMLGVGIIQSIHRYG